MRKFKMNPKTNKKVAFVVTLTGAVVAISTVVYKLVKKHKSKKTETKLFTVEPEEYFRFWESDAITDECINIQNELGDMGPFTIDTSISSVDDIDETDDFVVVHSESGKSYKIELSKTLGQHKYHVM